MQNEKYPIIMSLDDMYKTYEDWEKDYRAPQKSIKILFFRDEVPAGTSKVRTFEKQSFSSAHFLEVP